MKRIMPAIAVFFLVTGASIMVYGEECKECTEVAKGGIPQKFLEKTVKELPSGIRIWDSHEAVAAINDKESKILWVDTRPKSFFANGTVKNAVNLYYDQKTSQIPESEKGLDLTAESLKNAILKIDADPAKVRVAFFCQGPECHRSYNAALRSLGEFGLQAGQIIWFRDGYPGLLDFINRDPKLNKKMGRYIQGKDVTE